MILTMMIEMLKCWYLGRVLFMGFSLATGQAMTWVWLCWWPNPRSRWLGQCCWPIWNQPMQCWPTKYQISTPKIPNTHPQIPNTHPQIQNQIEITWLGQSWVLTNLESTNVFADANLSNVRHRLSWKEYWEPVCCVIWSFEMYSHMEMRIVL